MWCRYSFSEQNKYLTACLWLNYGCPNIILKNLLYLNYLLKMLRLTVFLVDHAWTFRADNYTESLKNHPQLLSRMCNLMGLFEEKPLEDRISFVSENIWKYCQNYTIANAVNVEDRLPVWYIMDEVGSALIHNDEPNFRAVPFVYLADNMTYTVIFPIKDLDFGEFLSRDFAEGILDKNIRDTFLLPWKPKSFLEVDCKQIEPPVEYFLSGHVEESLPDTLTPKPELNCPIKVFTEYDLIEKNLSRSEFTFADESTANILWYTSHFKNFAELKSNQIVNQFPFEFVITIKDLLSIVCRRKSVNGEYPKWLPITYNLKTELAKFISYYQKRVANNEPNFWILKPWNLARGLDTHITSNLDKIIRLANAGPPKICQLYITNPVLFERPECNGKVKFDLRYVILVKNVKPLEAYIYKNFFIRFSNKPFELKDFDDYEKHFTVMNYNENVVLKHMLCSEFQQKWTEQFAKFPWVDIETKILFMLRQTFEAAIVLPPPRGIAPSQSSRALYAVDLMLEWNNNNLEIEPKLLEINWTPDCKRACDYYPDFYNKIFGLLFLDEMDDEVFQEIK